MNDITVFFKYVIKAKLFADDLKMYANVRSLAKASAIANTMRIQDDLYKYYT